MIEVIIGEWAVSVQSGLLPSIYESYRENASFIEEIELEVNDKAIFYVGIGQAGSSRGWPSLVVCQTYSPAGNGFRPGILIAPETNLLFIGAGERLLAYNLIDERRLWIDQTVVGFWGWSRYRNYVILSAELEFAVFNVEGKRLWAISVEPPWNFTFLDDIVELDVMGRTQLRRLENGKKI